MINWILWLMAVWAFLGLGLWDWITFVNNRYEEKMGKEDRTRLLACLLFGPIGIVGYILTRNQRKQQKISPVTWDDYYEEKY